MNLYNSLTLLSDKKYKQNGYFNGYLINRQFAPLELVFDDFIFPTNITSRWDSIQLRLERTVCRKQLFFLSKAPKERPVDRF